MGIGLDVEGLDGAHYYEQDEDFENDWHII